MKLGIPLLVIGAFAAWVALVNIAYVLVFALDICFDILFITDPGEIILAVPVMAVLFCTNIATPCLIFGARRLRKARR